MALQEQILNEAYRKQLWPQTRESGEYLFPGVIVSFEQKGRPEEYKYRTFEFRELGLVWPEFNAVPTRDVGRPFSWTRHLATFTGIRVDIGIQF